MEMECAQIEGVIANQCAHWCGNPPVLPRTIGFDLIRPSGTFPSQGKAWSRPYIINKCKFACIILLRRLDVNQNQAYLATTAAIRSNWASMSVTSLNWVRALSRFCSG